MGKQFVINASALCLGAIVALGAASANAVQLSLLPAVSNVDNGDMVALDLVIDGLGNFTADSLGNFDLNVTYDTGALQFDGYALGDFLGDLGAFEAIDFSLGDLGGGIINLAELSLLEADAVTCVFCGGPFLDDIQPGAFTLATLDFTVVNLSEGSSTTVDFGSVFALGDGFGQALNVAGLNSAVLRNPRIGVPEPSALALFGLGVVLVGAARRRGLAA